jgi:hypothetical protein
VNRLGIARDLLAIILTAVLGLTLGADGVTDWIVVAVIAGAVVGVAWELLIDPGDDP